MGKVMLKEKASGLRLFSKEEMVVLK